MGEHNERRCFGPLDPASWPTWPRAEDINRDPASMALRHNEGKPELSYLLTFGDTAIDAAFHDLRYLPCIQGLGKWYRGEEVRLNRLVENWLADLSDWPEALCRVMTHAAESGKYPRGNYLAGHPWSSVVDSLLRHVKAESEGRELDAESNLPIVGHIAFGLLQLLYCATNFPELDNRIKAPAKEQTK